MSTNPSPHIFIAHLMPPPRPHPLLVPLSSPLPPSLFSLQARCRRAEATAQTSSLKLDRLIAFETQQAVEVFQSGMAAGSGGGNGGTDGIMGSASDMWGGHYDDAGPLAQSALHAQQTTPVRQLRGHGGHSSGHGGYGEGGLDGGDGNGGNGGDGGTGGNGGSPLSLAAARMAAAMSPAASKAAVEMLAMLVPGQEGDQGSGGVSYG